MKLAPYLGPAQKAKSLEVAWFLFHVTDEQSVSILMQITSSFLGPIIISGMWGGAFICCFWDFYIRNRRHSHGHKSPKVPRFKEHPLRITSGVNVNISPKSNDWKESHLLLFLQYYYYLLCIYKLSMKTTLRHMLLIGFWLKYYWYFL